MASIFSRSNLRLEGLEWRVALAGFSLFTAGALARGLFVAPPKRRGILESPRTTVLPQLSDEELSKLAYPPDLVPGARDVDTPYGSIRVYEFGPEDGRKVVMVHGISTPALALGSVAHHLVENGCRVLLFDLFGRGYSDTPADLNHDDRLFTTQILLALASSPLSWTGASSGKFTLIGYSIGGGVAANFASYFPDLVDTLVLFAPAGLIRPYHMGGVTRFIFQGGVIPESLLLRVVASRLRSPVAPPDKTKAGAETKPNLERYFWEKYPAFAVDAVAALADQVNHHAGFISGFLSTVRNGPTQGQHDRWRVVGDRLTSQNVKNGTSKKVLLVMGETDPIINLKEVSEDATEVLSGNVEIVTFNAGHEVPVTFGKEIVSKIVDFWKRND